MAATASSPVRLLRRPMLPSQRRERALRAIRSVSKIVERSMTLAAATVLLASCGEGVLDPHGPVGKAERVILYNATAIMLAVVVPVILLTAVFAYWFRADNTRAKYLPDWEYSGSIEMIVWSIPALVVLFLGGIAWVGSHELDPPKLIESAIAPVDVEVISLDWKWLFIYPAEGIASLNRLVVPAGVPLRFRLTSSSVMNSFFVPQLGSQIYTMPGMITRLHLQADQSGSYRGMSAQFSGDGFADMYFNVEAVAPEKFSEWVDTARNVGAELNVTTYAELAKPSASVAPFTYRAVAPDLFDSLLVSEVQSDDAMCRRNPTSMRAEK